MATEIASAYVALYAKMPGVQKDIEQALGGAESAAQGQGAGVGSAFLKGLKGVGIAGAVAVGAAAIGTLGTALVRGFGRLEAIDQAEAKLTGLGHSAEGVEQIMSDALGAVRGTAFGMDAAATTAAGAVAAGVAPGKELENTLRLMADAATIAGTDMASMGSIFNKVATSDMMQMDVANQLMDAGIPILQLLAEELGVTADEARKMASAGEISFETFQAAMEEGLGGAALASGETFSGAMSNLGASLSRIGAGLLEGVFPHLAPLLTAITQAMGPLEDVAGDLGSKFGELLAPAIEGFIGLLESGIDFGAFFEMASALSPVMQAFKILQPMLPTILDLFMELGTAVGGAFTSVMQALAPIITTIIGVLVELAAQVLPVLLPIITQLAEIFAEIMTVAMPIVEMLLPVLMTLFQALMPIIMQVLEAVMPLVEAAMMLVEPLLDLVMMVLPLLIELFMGLLPFVMALVEGLLNFLIPVIMGVVDAVVNFLAPIIESIQTILEGVMDFIIGVFSGDWERAWEGIVSIFSGIWEGIKGIVVGVINFIVDMINGVINGINSVADGISDLTGGAIALSIPNIPRLAQGGIVRARPGGILANIGEGRSDEAVVPLDDKFYSALSGRGEVNVNVYPSQLMDAHLTGRAAAEELAYVLRG